MQRQKLQQHQRQQILLLLRLVVGLLYLFTYCLQKTDGWILRTRTTKTRRKYSCYYSSFPIATPTTATATTKTTIITTSRSSLSCYSFDNDCNGDNNNNNNNHEHDSDCDDDDDDTIITLEKFTLEQFKRRKEKYERKNRIKMICRPPNPFLCPKQFITEILYELQYPTTTFITTTTTSSNNNNNNNNNNNQNNNNNHSIHSGVLCLLQSSTKSWQRILCQSVGITISNNNNDDDDYEMKKIMNIACNRLEISLKRKNNQFAILMGNNNNNSNNIDDVDDISSSSSSSSFIIDFPTDVIDYGDGTCWVECRLREKIDNDSDELLVVTGWSLQQRSIDGSWLINGLDWQDFRDDFRPGIGREEWERICG